MFVILVSALRHSEVMTTDAHCAKDARSEGEIVTSLKGVTNIRGYNNEVTIYYVFQIL